jgi:hypothetical protein
VELLTGGCLCGAGIKVPSPSTPQRCVTARRAGGRRDLMYWDWSRWRGEACSSPPNTPLSTAPLMQLYVRSALAAVRL